MINRYGPIRQLAYVARDIPAVMAYFIKLGIGPWYYGKNADLFDFDYCGSDVQPDLEFAIAPWAGLQLELLCQKSETPSILLPWMRRPFEQMLQHHVAIWPDDYDGTVAQAVRDGYEVQQRANTIAGRFCYLINPAQPEFVLEITEQTAMRREFGNHIHESQNEWNATNAIRSFGPR